MNRCACKNGVGATGTDCPVNGAVKCASCNHGFTVNHARTECIGMCPGTHEPQQNHANMLKSIGCYLVANVCTCENGVAQLGVDCTVNGAAKCSSCNSGWTINHDSTKCIRTCLHLNKKSQQSNNGAVAPLHCLFVVNTCTCKNGVAPIGVHCPAHGAAKCVSCNAGFTINQARTECTCKFLLNEQIVIAV